MFHCRSEVRELCNENKTSQLSEGLAPNLNTKPSHLDIQTKHFKQQTADTLDTSKQCCDAAATYEDIVQVDDSVQIQLALAQIDLAEKIHSMNMLNEAIALNNSNKRVTDIISAMEAERDFLKLRNEVLRLENILRMERLVDVISTVTSTLRSGEN